MNKDTLSKETRAHAEITLLEDVQMIGLEQRLKQLAETNHKLRADDRMLLECLDSSAVV